MKIRQNHAEEALLVQSAVNLSGIVHSFSRVIKEIWQDYYVELEKANKEAEQNPSLRVYMSWHPNNHPACVLFAEQIKHLTSSSSLTPNRSYSESYTLCCDAKESKQDYIEVS